MKYFKLLVFITFFTISLATTVVADTVTDILGEAESKTYNLNNNTYLVEVLLIRDWPPEMVDFNINSDHIGPLEEKQSVILKEGARLTINDIYFVFAGELGWRGIVNFTLTDPPAFHKKNKLQKTNPLNLNYTSSQTGSTTTKEKCPALRDGMTITKSITLCQNAVYNLPHGITIAGDNITVDCNDSIIIGNISEYGITLDNIKGTTLKNCNVHSFNVGIFVVDGSNNYLTGNYVDSSSAPLHYSGIWLVNSHKNILENNTLQGRGFMGIKLSESDQNILKDNSIIKFCDGLILVQSNKNKLNGNYITEGNNEGIIIISSSFNIVRNNQIVDNILADAIFIQENAYDNLIINNFLKNNQKGIYLDQTNGNIIMYNHISNNEYGFYTLQGIINNSIMYNDIFDNQVWNFHNHANSKIIAEDNWWGTTNKTQIEESIYHGISGGYVDFEPYLNESVF